MNQDLTLLNADALQQAYAQGLCDPVAVTRAHLARIALRNPALHAFVHVCSDQALQQAHASAQRWASGQPLGPLDGVVMALKDNIDVVGMPCTAGTAAFAQRIPTRDAPIYQRLSAAGMVLLGKLNMHEAALGATTDNPVYGRCMNPLREGYTPGGSSGGSSAAVADHLCTLAMGTDTMGSVRIPAAYCGVMGMIPTRTRLPMDGIVPLSPTLDVAGPLARSGQDLAQVMACLLGINLGPAAQASVWRGLRVGILPQTSEVEMAPAVQAAWQATQTLETTTDQPGCRLTAQDDKRSPGPMLAAPEWMLDDGRCSRHFATGNEKSPAVDLGQHPGLNRRARNRTSPSRRLRPLILRGPR